MFSWFRKSTRLSGFSKDKGCGSELGVPTGCDDAIKWFRKAAEKGTRWGQLNLGIRYLRGEGVPQDYTEAIKWFQEGSAQGDALSQYYLGTLHEKGLGTAVDQVEAYKWYGLAASHGIQEAENARQKLRQELTPEQVLEGSNRAAESAPGK
jgi:TPR repeat protein